MKNLYDYISSSFNMIIDVDARQYCENTCLNLLEKNLYYVYFTPITFSGLSHKISFYKSIAQKAFDIWSNATGNKIKFVITEDLYGSDISVYWGKTTRNAAGLQYEQNGRKCVTISLLNINGSQLSDNAVFHLFLHEFGHVLGLGHSKNTEDIMSIKEPWPDKLSENDIFVLNLIYEIGSKVSLAKAKQTIINKIKEYKTPKIIVKTEEKNLFELLNQIGNRKKNNIFQQNIKVKLIPRQIIFTSN